MSVRDFRWLPILIAVCGSPIASVAADDKPASGQAKAVVSELRSKEVETRRHAAEKLRLSERLIQEAALPVLIELLMEEKDGQVRLAVLEIVTALGADAAPAVPALVHTLRTRYGGSGQEELHQDYRTAWALASVGKPAVEGLRGLLGERKASVRAEAIMGLGRIGPDAESVIPELIGLLAAPEEFVSREASVALGRIGDTAVAPLITASANDNPGVRSRAIQSLGAIPGANDRVRHAVLEATRDASPRVRSAALSTLSRVELPPDAILLALKENIRHDDAEVRLAVVDLLMEHPGLLPTLSPEFGTLLIAQNTDVSRLAAFLLGKIGPPAAPSLIGALRDKNSRIDQIADGLAGMGRPISGILNEALTDDDPRVRRGAALALGQIRPAAPETGQRLVAGLMAPEREVRADILTAIGHLGSRAADAVPIVRKSLKDESPEVRLKAIEFLARAAPRDGALLADLISMLDDPDTIVQCKAIEIIRGLGPLCREALPAVISKLKSPSTEVRLAASEMVKAHGQAAAQAVPGLISILDDPSPMIRTSAVQALGMIGPPAQPAFDRLTALLSSDQPATRESVVSAIGSLSLQADVLRPAFNKALRDEKAEVRRAAMRAIQKLGPNGVIFVPDIILMAEKKENLRSVERMLRRFETQGPDVRSLPELIRHLENRQESVRLLAIKFLALAGENAREAIPVLERMHEDASAEIRKQAEAACKRIKKESAAGRLESQVQ